MLWVCLTRRIINIAKQGNFSDNDARVVERVSPDDSYDGEYNGIAFVKISKIS